jgi:hypothetical protein
VGKQKLGHYLIMGCTFMGAVTESHWLVYLFVWLGSMILDLLWVCQGTSSEPVIKQESILYDN